MEDTMKFMNKRINRKTKIDIHIVDSENDVKRFALTGLS